MEALPKQRKKKYYVVWLESFARNFNNFMRDTGMHGLKFVADNTITYWERSFFLIGFVAAFFAMCYLISDIYTKWGSTPVIIGISPHATSVQTVPFPAITICNMNQVLASKVENYTDGSSESAILKLLCNSIDGDMPLSAFYANNNLKISDFVLNHSQPCAQMLLYCRFSSIEYNCEDLFVDIMTDEGLCCVFNMLPPELLYKRFSKNDKDLTNDMGHVAVKWDPESGYPEKLPPKYYPHKALGPGISLGFSMVLNAQIDEYYCSSTNGPGFKVFFHNPIELPSVKEAGLIVSIGYETNFRLEVIRAEAVPTIRSIAINDRQCVFKDEVRLLYHKLYTRRNCENECIAKSLYEACECIPYNLPLIYSNATVCNVKDTLCIGRVDQWSNRLGSAKCRDRCLPPCFDLTYLPDGFISPLATKKFKTSNDVVANMNKSYVKDNIAIVNLYYRESVYHGNMKNVYIGLTEFLSNIGGVMGLFTGFSIISLAEMIYFLIIKPIFELLIWKRTGKIVTQDESKPNISEGDNFPTSLDQNEGIWYAKELYPKGIILRGSKLIGKSDKGELSKNMFTSNKLHKGKNIWQQ